jgi:hypothetical protein
VPTRRHTQPIQQSLTRTTAQRATHQPMDFTQTICLLGMREQDAVDALGENPT